MTPLTARLLGVACVALYAVGIAAARFGVEAVLAVVILACAAALAVIVAPEVSS